MNRAQASAASIRVRSKYRNVKARVDGHTFDSQAEAARYLVLRNDERRGMIADLELQPRFELLPAFKDWKGSHHRKIEYVADFRYTHRGKVWIEDAKGYRTEVYKLKVKLFLSFYRSLCFREIDGKGRMRA